MSDPATGRIGLQGRLDIDVDGSAFAVNTDGSLIRVDVARQAHLLSVVRGLPDALASRRGLARTATMLDRLGLEVALNVEGQTLVRLGHGVTPSASAKLTGIGPVHATIGTLVKLWRLRRRS